MARLGRPPKSEKLDRDCQTCGKTWQDPSWMVPRKFCSRECWRQSRLGVPRGPYAVPREVRKCEYCGTEFSIGGTEGSKRRAAFCSVKCAINGRWVGKPGHQRPRQMTPEETAWFAGIFDGEGCIAWPRRTLVKSFRLSIANTSLRLLEKVEEIVGTGRTYDRSAFRKSAKHNNIWVWQCHGENARLVLSQIYPWLIVKKEAADVALGFVAADEPPLSNRTKATLAAEEATPLLS